MSTSLSAGCECGELIPPSELVEHEGWVEAVYTCDLCKARWSRVFSRAMQHVQAR